MRRWTLLLCLLIIAGLPAYATSFDFALLSSTAGINAPSGLLSKGEISISGTGTITATDLLDVPEPTPAALAIFGLCGIGLLAMRRSANRD